MFWVEKTSYGVTITDAETREAIAVEADDLKDLIRDLQHHIPFDFNEVAMLPICLCAGGPYHSLTCPANKNNQPKE